MDTKPMRNKFKRLKGVDDDIRDIIFYDLECLDLKDTVDNKYHYNLLRQNLICLLGKKDE